MSMVDSKLYFIDTVNGESLKLQFVPKEVTYEPDSRFPGIYVIGRNNPIYHYTGSEDTLTFELDWHSEIKDKNDVIAKCRWVEALTKADGYKKGPHAIRLKWGEADVFADSLWLVTAAPYTLSLYDKPAGMMPKQAYQPITLKRVTTSNRTHEEINKYPNAISISNTATQ